MATIYNFDFEQANLAAFLSATGWDTTGAGALPVLSSAQSHTGAQSLLCNDTSGNVSRYVESGAIVKTDLFGRMWIYVTTAASDGPRGLIEFDNSNGDLGELQLNTNRTLSIAAPNQGTALITTTTAVALNTWTEIFFHFKWAGASCVFEIKIGNETQTSTSNQGTFNITNIRLGLDNFAGATTVYYDTFTIDDAAYPTDGTITTSVVSLPYFGIININKTSTSAQYVVSGTALTNDITVTAPNGYQVSLDNSSFATSKTITQAGGSASSAVYSEFAPITYGFIQDNILHSSTGATSVNVNVSGTCPVTFATIQGSGFIIGSGQIFIQ